MKENDVTQANKVANHLSDIKNEPIQMPDTVNINLNLPRESAEMIQDLYELFGSDGTKTDTLKLCVDIAYACIITINDGGEVIVVEPDGGESKLVVPHFQENLYVDKE